MVWLQSAVLCLSMSSVGQAGQAELLDFTAPWCGPCQQMQPVVDSMAAHGYKIRKVDFDRDRALVAQYKVSAIPCFVMLVNGQEVDRVTGGTTQARLERMFKVAASAQPSAAATSAAGPTVHPTAFAQPGAQGAPPIPAAHPPQPPQPSAAELAAIANAKSAGNMPANVSQDPLAAFPSAVGQGPHRQQLAAAGASLNAGNETAKTCLAATVRLKIADPKGNSVGSGTIIDSRAGEALVLTCGHVFRDSAGKGKISVDLFGPGAPKDLEGELIGYDLKRDVGLVSIRPGQAVTVARLAPPNYAPKRGDVVMNVGCDNGREPTVLRSQINGVDKYEGPSNIEVAGQPVEGRSGGGLFTADGVVIGVCNAADPKDNEGLYAGLRTIHEQVAQLGLTQMLSTGADAQSLLAGAAPPNMSKAMPEVGAPVPPPRMLPTGAEAPLGTMPNASSQSNMTAAEQAILNKVRGDSAEVILLVRPTAPQSGETEALALDRASPEFLRQLTAARGQRTSQHPTMPEPPAPRDALRTADNWVPPTSPQRFR